MKILSTISDIEDLIIFHSKYLKDIKIDIKEPFNVKITIIVPLWYKIIFGSIYRQYIEEIIELRKQPGTTYQIKLK